MDFTESTFDNDVSPNNSVIDGTLILDLVHSYRKFQLVGMTIGNDLVMNRMEGTDMHMSATRIEGNTYCKNSSFEGPFLSTGVIFNGTADFSNTMFHGFSSFSST